MNSEEFKKFMTRHLPLPLMRDPDFGYWHPLGKKKQPPKEEEKEDKET